MATLSRACVLALCAAGAFDAPALRAQEVVRPLPEGPGGIASRYAGDLGIDRDPAVVFRDDFEGGTTRFDNSWGGIGLAPQAENVHGGKGALECVLPWPRPSQETGKGVAHHFKEGFDTLHLRYYAKFGKAMELYHGGTHDGGSILARAPGVPDAKPGVPADGRNEYSVLLDTWRPDDTVASPGALATYVYHPEQRHRWGEHFFPSGKTLPFGGSPACFGGQFAPRPEMVPERDRWVCYELMVKANVPGRRDGRIAFWVDGRLAADFPNLRLRDVESLKANRIGLGLYTMNGMIRTPCAMWFDDVVAATSYIGPVAKRKTQGPARSADDMARARAGLARGDFAAAWRHLDRVDSDDLLREAQELIRKIEEVVRGRLRDAEALAAIGEKADAAEAYRQILREFQGIPLAEEARTRIEALRASPLKADR
jgi:hypothetical protein